jgi:hypothetical protein
MIVTIGYTGLRWAETIGLERDLTHPGGIHVEWQLHELNGKFHRLPPKDDSYRSSRWEPSLPVDLPPFLDEMLAIQIQDHPHPLCACVGQHGGSGRYVFLGPDGGHYRRSNYARRVFRPRLRRTVPSRTRPPGHRRPSHRLARHPDRRLANRHEPGYRPRHRIPSAKRPRHRGHPPDTPLACWLPIKPGLTAHGLRHSHKTWMAEDGIPEILAEQRLGHQVPGMRGLYAHASDRMRDDLKQTLQARWQEALQDRAAINEHSSVPLLNQLLAPARATTDDEADHTTAPPTAPGGRRQGDRPGDDDPPNSSQPPPRTPYSGG